jgi:ketosteroid isomerase-like protein
MAMSRDRSEDEAAILVANAAFYRAFSKGDYAAMSALWAERAHVACFHPTAPAILGRDAVLESWRQILRNAPSFDMRCDRPVVHLAGGAAFVTCYEGNGEHPAHLAATNVFVLEDGSWRMVHHHAGPLAAPIAKPATYSAAN